MFLSGHRPGGEEGVSDEVTAERRGGERRGGALAELEGELVEGLLGVFEEAGGQLARHRVRFDPAGGLDDDAAVGDLGDNVEGQQRVEGVVEGLAT